MTNIEIESIGKYICILSYILYVVLLISYPLRKKKWLENAGKIKYESKKHDTRIFYMIVCLVPILITVTLIRNLGLFMNCIMCACSIFALEIMVRDTISKKTAGIYENACITDGKYIPLDDIIALPTLAYEGDTSVSTLKIVTNKHGEMYLNFPDERERKDFVKNLVELLPRLKA